MKLPKVVIGLGILVTLALTLTGCRNCSDSGICPLERSAPYQLNAEVTPNPVILHPGETLQARVLITRSGMSDTAPLMIGSDTSNDPAILATFDHGHVTVRSVGGSLTGTETVLLIHADEHATADQQVFYSLAGERAFIRKLDDTFKFPVNATISIQP